MISVSVVDLSSVPWTCIMLNSLFSDVFHNFLILFDFVTSLVFAVLWLESCIRNSRTKTGSFTSCTQERIRLVLMSSRHCHLNLCPSPLLRYQSLKIKRRSKPSYLSKQFGDNSFNIRPETIYSTVKYMPLTRELIHLSFYQMSHKEYHQTNPQNKMSHNNCPVTRLEVNARNNISTLMISVPIIETIIVKNHQ